MREYVRHRAGIPVCIISAGQEYPYVLQNVSLGGAACQGSQKFEIDSPVEISMYLLRPVYTSPGRVVWCKDNDGGYELGIEFSGERNKARLNMVEQISHIEHYRNEVKTVEGRSISGEEAAREWVSIHASEFPEAG